MLSAIILTWCFVATLYLLRANARLGDQVDKLETWKWITIAREKQRIVAERIADSQGHSVHEENEKANTVPDERYSYTNSFLQGLKRSDYTASETDLVREANRLKIEREKFLADLDAEYKRRLAISQLEEPAGEGPYPQFKTDGMLALSAMNGDPSAEPDAFRECDWKERVFVDDFTHCRDCCAMIYCQRFGVCVIKDAGHMA